MRTKLKLARETPRYHYIYLLVIAAHRSASFTPYWSTPLLDTCDRGRSQSQDLERCNNRRTTEQILGKSYFMSTSRLDSCNVTTSSSLERTRDQNASITSTYTFIPLRSIPLDPVPRTIPFFEHEEMISIIFE